MLHQQKMLTFAKTKWRVLSKNKISILFLGAFCLLHIGCSTTRNTPFTRAYHQLVVRYNLFFNAQQAYDELLRVQTESFQDDFSEMLPIFPFVRLTEKTQRGGAFDTVVERMERAIRNHSILSESGHEYNPFMKNVWLLLGKAHVQNQDYDDALAVFSHIANLFRDDADVVAEAKVWTMRAYIETGRLCKAENLANGLKEIELSADLNALFAKTYAYLLFEKGKYAEAIPFLQKTIEFQRNNIQRRRLQFLLGQTFAAVGDNAAAFRTFESVHGMRTPHQLSLNATLQQASVVSESQKPQMLRELHRLSRRAVNRGYLNQIHLAISDIYFRKNDTASAERHYALAQLSYTPFSPASPQFLFPFEASTFYFFNPQSVVQGRYEFQRLWGNRALEDNWRTQNRQAILLIEPVEE